MSSDRQRVVRVPGSRRARLTPAPGTSEEPVVADEPDEAAEGGASGTPRPVGGPNDERMLRDVPPHY